MTRILFVLMVVIGSAAPALGQAKKVNPLLTKENFDKIKNGMTVQEVRDILGPAPTTMSSGKDLTHMWRRTSSGKDKEMIKVHFKDGIVVSKSSTINWDAASAGPAKGGTPAADAPAAWVAQVAKIQSGMTEDEVKKLLGEPTAVEKASGGRSAFIWQDKDRFAYVIFKGEKAVARDSSELPPETTDISRGLFQRIRVGMTQAEAVALLGEPRDTSDSHLYWRQDKKFITLKVENGKVTSKQSSETKNSFVVFEKTEEDRIEAAVGQLRSKDVKTRRHGFDNLAKLPFQEAYGAEVSRLAQAALKDKDDFVRHSAERTLRTWATPENSAYFLKILSAPISNKVNDPNRDKLDLAVAVLVKIREPKAAAPLCRLLHNFFDRDTATKGLIELGADIAAPEVAKHLNDKDFNVRKACQDILKEFKTDGDVVLTRCLIDLKSNDPEKRGAAIGRMVDMPVDKKRQAEVAGILEEHLGDKSFYTAHLAASLLGKWGTVKNESALDKVLAKHPSREMKAIVCRSLKEIGTKESLGLLQPLTKDFDTALSSSAREAIAAIQARQR